MEEVKRELLRLGYSEDASNEIINAYALNNMKPETLLKRIKENTEFFKFLGYSQEEVIKMTKGLPTIYGSSIENIIVKLFINQKRFENQYGITKKELLEKYDYTEYMKQKSHKETVKKLGQF